MIAIRAGMKVQEKELRLCSIRMLKTDETKIVASCRENINRNEQKDMREGKILDTEESRKTVLKQHADAGDDKEGDTQNHK